MPKTDGVQHTIQPSGQQAYALLVGTYGHINALSFARVLTDKRGNADLVACHIVEWCLDWYRPTRDGTPRVRGTLYLDSAGLADAWNVSAEQFRRARARVSRAGLVVFEKHQHQCHVVVQWARVAEVLDGVLTPRLNPDGAKTPCLDSSDGAKTPHKLLLPRTSPAPTSPSAEDGAQEEEVQHTTDKAYAIADRLVAYGTERGRRCDGAWAQAAREAVRDALRDGRDPKVLEAAWTAYIGRDGSTRTDLAHWLKGQGLNGEPRDEGPLAFDAVYEQVQHTLEQAQERRRIQQGGVPEHPHFAPSQAGWVVGWEGHGHVLYDAVPASASEAEARAAFPDWYRRHHG